MSEVIVPIMALGYLLIALVVIVFLNIEEIPALVYMIVTELLTKFCNWWRNCAIILQGAKRGMFSNEAGLGSAPNVAAVAYVSTSSSTRYSSIILCIY